MTHKRKKTVSWTSSKLKILCFRGHHKVKRQTEEWETIFTSHISDKGL